MNSYKFVLIQLMNFELFHFDFKLTFHIFRIHYFFLLETKTKFVFMFSVLYALIFNMRWFLHYLSIFHVKFLYPLFWEFVERDNEPDCVGNYANIFWVKINSNIFKASKKLPLWADDANKLCNQDGWNVLHNVNETNSTQLEFSQGWDEKMRERQESKKIHFHHHFPCRYNNKNSLGLISTLPPGAWQKKTHTRVDLSGAD